MLRDVALERFARQPAANDVAPFAQHRQSVAAGRVEAVHGDAVGGAGIERLAVQRHASRHDALPRWLARVPREAESSRYLEHGRRAPRQLLLEQAHYL